MATEIPPKKLVDMAFKATETGGEKAFLTKLSKQSPKVQAGFERLMKKELSPVKKLRPGTKGLASGLALGALAESLTQEDAPDERGERSGGEWAKGMVKFSDAMEVVAAHISTASEVDAVEADLEPLILKQNPRRRERLAVPGVYPNGTPKKYIMRRDNGEALPENPTTILAELVPYTSGDIGSSGEGWEFADLEPLRVELIPVKG